MKDRPDIQCRFSIRREQRDRRRAVRTGRKVASERRHDLGVRHDVVREDRNSRKALERGRGLEAERQRIAFTELKELGAKVERESFQLTKPASGTLADLDARLAGAARTAFSK